MSSIQAPLGLARADLVASKSESTRVQHAAHGMNATQLMTSFIHSHSLLPVLCYCSSSCRPVLSIGSDQFCTDVLMSAIDHSLSGSIHTSQSTFHSHTLTRNRIRNRSRLHLRPSIGEQLIQSILSPGVTPVLHIALNIVLCLVLLISGFIFAIGRGSVHVIALLLLALALIASLNYFIFVSRSVNRTASDCTRTLST